MKLVTKIILTMAFASVLLLSQNGNQIIKTNQIYQITEIKVGM